MRVTPSLCLAQGICDLLSLSLKVSTLVSVKLLSGIFLGLIVASITMSIALVWLSPSALDDIWLYIMILVTQAFALAGLMVTASFWVENPSNLSIISVLLGGLLQYASTVFLPLSLVPHWLRPLLFLNPVTLTAELLRDLPTINFQFLSLLCLSAVVWFALGSYLLRRRVRATLE